MKIDAHQHFWQFDSQRDTWITNKMAVLKRDFLPKDIALLLQAHQFDGCVAVQADSSEKETEFLLALASKNSLIKGVVGWLDLCDDAINDRLAHFSSNKKLKGLRHIVQAEANGFMQSKNFQRGILALKEYGLTYDVLLYPHQLEEAIAMVAAFPKQKFILDHCAKPYIKDKKISTWKTHMETLANFENVACKVSGLTTEANWNTWNTDTIEPYLDVVFHAFGMERTLFGSDWPVCLLAGNYMESVRLIEDYILQFSETERQRIMGLNAEHWYALKDE